VLVLGPVGGMELAVSEVDVLSCHDGRGGCSLSDPWRVDDG
jgi:hypothetical protein